MISLRIFLFFLLVVLSCQFGAKAAVSVAPVWKTPSPPYPSEARINREAGEGLFEVITGSDGRAAQVKIIKSTGSALLNETVTRFAGNNWSGPPNTSRKVPVHFRLDKPDHQTVLHIQTDERGAVKTATVKRSSGSPVLDDATVGYAVAHWHGKPNTTLDTAIQYRVPSTGVNKNGWRAPVPPYPYVARARYEQGGGMVRVQTNAQGKVVHAEMARSTGSKVLDQNTINYALENWSGPPSSRTLFPVVYRLRH